MNKVTALGLAVLTVSATGFAAADSEPMQNAAPVYHPHRPPVYRPPYKPEPLPPTQQELELRARQDIYLRTQIERAAADGRLKSIEAQTADQTDPNKSRPQKPGTPVEITPR
ncbi:hypothetical protein [Parachitinimonas caeni]|uniref:DUF4148 domain-containing protein n=1 Tax=Parachitinimonas caeni TaxID=3031301 RepID=A0ABT7E1A6_9NEIS|nr:hypothetical protein [Parachitinimonas caeni]MDK2126093.1 hypothetical protein [Parachitinimonas caeni]